MKNGKQSFSDLALGDQGIILSYGDGKAEYQRKLMSLGLTPGTSFNILKVAPLGDPVEIEIRGYRLSLRRREAACLQVEKL